MEKSRVDFIDRVLIVSITPYFLEKGNLWFEENFAKIMEARKTQTFFEDNILYLEKNRRLHLSETLRKLDEMGYEKVLDAREPGEFSQRGGAINVFPINLNYAVRFEFLGNKIENIEKLPIEVGNEKIQKEILKKRLKSGDYLVNLDHGIGTYNHQMAINSQQYYQLNYAAGDKLYVPLGLERKLSRYVGFVSPKISRLGSAIWQRTKRKVKMEAEKLAGELLEIYAKREIAARAPYLQDTELDFQLANSFKYEETPDQIQAIEEIKIDLEKQEPMDRIVCGDVGFGKTEVALRTMIKAVGSNYQVAMICPTTILANQHFQNFKERLKNFPIKIAILSRLQTKKEQKEIIDNLKKGSIDVVIGTCLLYTSPSPRD